MTVVKDKDKESQNALVRAFQQAIVQPLRESRAEMRKIVWPTREETIRLTVVVILLSAVMSAILFAADALFSWLLLLLQNAVATL
ncbi:MAG: preprotein translocase subunit SecE [Roseiflexaceae bacterium]|nr:preprotein translocase subunit SecE [Roseiflexus sp.]MDW8213472.1 preprotein translocase subunit SecE [Roseiflexaceae bacterium]